MMMITNTTHVRRIHTIATAVVNIIVSVVVAVLFLVLVQLHPLLLVMLLLIRDIEFLPLNLPVLIQVGLEGDHIVLEPEGRDGPDDVVAVDGLPLLPLALVGGLPSDEADELRHALLDRLLGVLRDLAVHREDLLHYPSNVCYGQEPVLFFVGIRSAIGGGLAETGALWAAYIWRALILHVSMVFV